MSQALGTRPGFFHRPHRFHLTMLLTRYGVREWLSATGMRAKVKVSRLGKTKTAFQMIGLSFLIYQQDLWSLPIYDIGLLLIVIAAGLTLWSMFDYWRAAWPLLTSE